MTHWEHKKTTAHRNWQIILGCKCTIFPSQRCVKHPPAISFLFSGHVTEAKRGIICDLISHGQQRTCKRLPHAHSQREKKKKKKKASLTWKCHLLQTRRFLSVSSHKQFRPPGVTQRDLSLSPWSVTSASCCIQIPKCVKRNE